MQDASIMETVDRYLAAVSARDFEAARGYLADRDFSYTSPIGGFDDADAFTRNMDGIGAILHRMDARHRFEAGEYVCHILDVTVAMAGYDTQTVAQLARVVDGRIFRLEVIFDASEFHRMVGRET